MPNHNSKVKTKLLMYSKNDDGTHGDKQATYGKFYMTLLYTCTVDV